MHNIAAESSIEWSISKEPTYTGIDKGKYQEEALRRKQKHRIAVLNANELRTICGFFQKGNLGLRLILITRTSMFKKYGKEQSIRY
jgi:hypothetical protein